MLWGPLPAACLTANSNNQLYISYSISLLAHSTVPDVSRDVRHAALLWWFWRFLAYVVFFWFLCSVSWLISVANNREFEKKQHETWSKESWERQLKCAAMLIPRPLFVVVSMGDIASRCVARLRILVSYRPNWKILGVGIQIVSRNPVKCTCTSLYQSRLPYILAQVCVGRIILVINQLNAQILIL